MHESVGYNGKIIKTRDALLPAASSAAFYGRGVFTTLAIYNRKPFLLDKHLHRLRAHARRINLDSTEIHNIEESLFDLIAANKMETGRARITLFDSSASAIWNFPSAQKTSVLITTAERSETKNDVRLTVSPFLINSASALAGIKSCNYLENLLALENAKRSGFDEAARFNEKGETVSACLANLFWTRDEQIFTAPLAAGALDGTTRNLVFELAKNLNLKVAETVSDSDALKAADEIFLTSSGIEICAVKSLDEKIYQNTITKKLKKAFTEFINQ